MPRAMRHGPKSPALSGALQNFADKLTGTSRIDNMKDKTSAAYKMAQSIGKKNLNDPTIFKPKPTSNGVGVGP